MCFSDVIVFLKAAGFGKRDDAGAADDDAGQLKNLWKVEHESAQHIFSVGPMRHSFGPLLQASL